MIRLGKIIPSYLLKGGPLPYLEWSTGIEHFVSMLPMMMASLRVHVPDSQRGIRIPEGNK